MRGIRIARIVWVALLFIVCGVGGFLLLMISSLALIPNANGEHFLNPLLALFLAAVGAVMMLFGAGAWNRRAYLWVFLSFPASLGLLSLARGASKGMGFMLMVTPSLVAYLLVRAYYRRRRTDEGNPGKDSTSALTSQKQEIK